MTIAPQLELEAVNRHYPVKTGLLGGLGRNRLMVKAVSDVSLTIHKGEILGLVGESGSGKSTLGRVELMLEPPSSGRLRFLGEDITGLPRDALKHHRRQAQMVFQDPQSSLNRSLSIGRSVESPLLVHASTLSREQRRARVGELLEMVGLRAAMAGRYPHELSGGQRQRVGIARALAVQPEFLVLDEPTSALDVSIQAQVINLLLTLQQDMALTYLFISHDLALVRWLCDRIAVMYLGRIVEIGQAGDVWARPRHPYTQALLAATGALGDAAHGTLISGEAPSAISPPTGCAFHPRCAHAGPRCTRERPLLIKDGGGEVACHLLDGGTA